MSWKKIVHFTASVYFAAANGLGAAHGAPCDQAALIAELAEFAPPEHTFEVDLNKGIDPLSGTQWSKFHGKKIAVRYRGTGDAWKDRMLIEQVVLNRAMLGPGIEAAVPGLLKLSRVPMPGGSRFQEAAVWAVRLRDGRVLSSKTHTSGSWKMVEPDWELARQVIHEALVKYGPGQIAEVIYVHTHPTLDRPLSHEDVLWLQKVLSSHPEIQRIAETMRIIAIPEEGRGELAFRHSIHLNPAARARGNDSR